MLTLLMTLALAVDPSPTTTPSPWKPDKCATETERLELFLLDTDVKHIAETFTKIVCKPVVLSSDVSDLKFSIFVPPQAAGGAAQTAGIDVTEKDGMVMLTKHLSK